ncbi:MAG: hypothetical protein M3015_11580 [Bacteroidota bacterium]|nr:hypothetical protein [Bacteroidota bacterium]
MYFQALYELLPKLAEAETRTITLVSDKNDFHLPAGNYSFIELFCKKEGCDCRRVMFLVVHDKEKEPLACIGYGWESESFYKKWMRSNDKTEARKLMKPLLNELSFQSVYARKILSMFNSVLLPSTSYLARVKTHYKLFREIVDRPFNLMR